MHVKLKPKVSSYLPQSDLYGRRLVQYRCSCGYFTADSWQAVKEYGMLHYVERHMTKEQ